MVGPVLAQDAKPLTPDLSAFLESGLAQGLGAILVFMGTLARLTDEEVHSMAAGLSALPNPVLWKLDASYLQGLTSHTVVLVVYGSHMQAGPAWCPWWVHLVYKDHACRPQRLRLLHFPAGS